MSYCRFIEADIYLYADVDGSIHCCGCWLEPTHKGNPNCGMQDVDFHGTKQFWKRSDAIAHITEHVKAGHRVPDHVTERLAKELLEFGDDTGKDTPATDKGLGK